MRSLIRSVRLAVLEEDAAWHGRFHLPGRPSHRIDVEWRATRSLFRSRQAMPCDRTDSAIMRLPRFGIELLGHIPEPAVPVKEILGVQGFGVMGMRGPRAGRIYHACASI